MVKVLRDSKWKVMDIKDIVVGDVLRLEVGDIVYVDGVLIDGYLRCDQSEITGETEPATKFPADLCTSRFKAGMENQGLDPFIISGSQITEGLGTYLVTTVGEQCYYQKVLRGMDILSFAG